MHAFRSYRTASAPVQATHAEPLDDAVPALHDVHVAAPLYEVVPGPQARHALADVVFENSPAIVHHRITGRDSANTKQFPVRPWLTRSSSLQLTTTDTRTERSITPSDNPGSARTGTVGARHGWVRRELASRARDTARACGNNKHANNAASNTALHCERASTTRDTPADREYRPDGHVVQEADPGARGRQHTTQVGGDTNKRSHYWTSKQWQAG